jgi:4-azaleucine resistance transporter AzlC
MPTGVPTLSASRSAVAGARDVAPVLLGIIPFGLFAGVVAVEAGLGLPEAIGFSTILFAGAAQIAAIDLLGGGSPAWVAILTAIVINLRMTMYSASLAVPLAGESRTRRLAAAYVLTDQAYALSVARYADGTKPTVQPWWFYVGIGYTLWFVWQICTVLGVLVGASVPDAVPLGFGVPLAFLAILVPSVTDRPTLAAAIVGAGVSVAAAPLPANAGMLLGAVSGVVVGALLARRRRITGPVGP